MATSDITPPSFPYVETHDHADKAFTYLRIKAIRAHEAHDGVYVLHLAHTALEALKHRPQSITFDEVRWCFFLALYWYLEDNTISLINDALKKVSTDPDDRLVIDLLLTLYKEPYRSIEPEVFKLPSQDWINQRALAIEDIAIQCHLLELIWWRSPTSEHFWSDVLPKWQAASQLPALTSSLNLVTERLRYQSAVLFGYKPAPGKKVADNILANTFRAFYECNWKDLDSLINKFVGRTQVEKSEYLSLFGFIQYSRSYRQITSNRQRQPESQAIDISGGNPSAIVKPELKSPKPEDSHDTYGQSLSRYYLCASRQVSHAHMRQQVENLQDTAIRVVHKQADESLYQYGVRLGMLGEIRALRDWDLASLIDIVALRSDIELEAGCKGNSSMAAAGICDALRSTRTPDPEKDNRIEKVVACLDSGSADQRSLVTRSIVASPPLEWQCAYRWISMLTDVIDDVGLLQVAKWIQGPEGRNDLTGWRLSYLEFWKDVLPYVSTAPAISDVLCSSFVNAASLPVRWSSDQDTLVAAIKYGSDQTSAAIIHALQNATQLNATAKEQRWRIIYQASYESPQLLPRVLEWLKCNIPSEYCRHFIKRLDSATTDGPIDDALFKTWLIARLEALTTKLNRPRGSTVSIGDEVNGQIFRLVTWTVEHKPLFEALILAINAKDGNAYSKAAGLMILASVVESGDNVIVDTVLICCRKWLTLGYVPAIDPWARLRQADDVSQNHLERELWFLIYVCVQKRPAQLRSPIWNAALQGNYRRSSDIVFAAIVWLALSTPEDPTSLAMITFTESLILTTADEHISRFIRTFAMYLKKPERHDNLSPISLTSAQAKLFLDFWSRHLASFAAHSRVDVRFEVAQALTAWRENDQLSFPKELREVQKSLADDARARVRWAVRQCKEFQSELG